MLGAGQPPPRAFPAIGDLEGKDAPPLSAHAFPRSAAEPAGGLQHKHIFLERAAGAELSTAGSVGTRETLKNPIFAANPYPCRQGKG